MKNDLLLKAAQGKKVTRTPVWIMRQAGRILPEYRAIRKEVKDFITLLKTPELVAEITIQPVDLLKVDAAIIFSDILVIAEAMGLNYKMVENKGPYFPKTIDKAKDINKLCVVNNLSTISYVIEAIQLTKRKLNNRVPLIGFAGAPFTLFCYMVEGGGSKTFSKARKMLYHSPVLAHQLLQLITDSTIFYLKNQITAGANLVQIFDSWAGILTPMQYEYFGLSYIQQICRALENTVPRIVFAKGAHFSFQSLDNLSCEGISLDWNVDIAEAKNKLKTKVLQGNLDPCALYSSAEEIEKLTKKMLNEFKGHKHIANLGHGVYPDTNPENVKAFIETVKKS